MPTSAPPCAPVPAGPVPAPLVVVPGAGVGQRQPVRTVRGTAVLAVGRR